jgi:phosphoribosylformimino-5-aminoimidazole carboxamide ribotide isomerase
MRIIPVLDLTGGVVVRGVGGRRREYRPVVSRLTRSCAPLDVARAFAEHFGLTELYLADLDAIAGGPPAWATYAALHAGGFRLWVDAGVRGAGDGQALARAGVGTVVVGLETVAGPQALGEVVAAFPERVVFSLDLRDGAPLGDTAGWATADVWSLAGRAVSLGVGRLLVLDLARVGGGAGTGTDALCARLAATYPEVEVSAGGGVRGVADLRRLRASGVRAALVASALHDGALTAADLRAPSVSEGGPAL